MISARPACAGVSTGAGPSRLSPIAAAFAATDDVETVVPIGLRAIKGVGFYVTEFEAVAKEDAENLTSLTLASDAIFELLPRIKGI